MAKSIMDINNEKAIVYLADEILNRRLTVFVGAGCSIDLGLPAWTDLLKEIQTKYKITSTETDPLRIAARIEKKVGALSFREEIVERVRTVPYAFTPLLKSLVRVDSNLFITTNYDSALEEAFRTEGIMPTVITQDEDIPSINPRKKTIVKLHGDIDSPSSIVITSSDYLKYGIIHLRFVEWLRSKATDNTVLFVGTSFTDERLRDVDNFVLKRFEKFRRPPCIFLRKPDKDKFSSPDDFLVASSEFEILLEEFKQKDFYVLIVQDYLEITQIIERVNNLVLEKRRQEAPSDSSIQLALKEMHAERLEKDLAVICDERIKDFTAKIWGGGNLPTEALMKERAEELLRYLNEKEEILDSGSKLEGFITLTDAYLHFEKPGHVQNARKHFDRANSIYQNISDQSKWKERFLRITAKLLFYEGKADEAIELASRTQDDKTIALWLSLLIGCDRIAEAYQYVSKNEIADAWRPLALSAFVLSGHANEAEHLFSEAYAGKDFSKKVVDYKKSCAFMAEAFLQLAIKLTGVSRLFVFPEDLGPDSERLCAKAVDYANKLVPAQDLKEDYFALFCLIIKMKALYLLKEFNSADQILFKVIEVTPLWRETAEYVASRVEYFDQDIVSKVVDCLLRDYKNQSWALAIASYLQIQKLKNLEGAWINANKVLELATEQVEKERAVGIIFDVGNQLKREEDAKKIIEMALPKENGWRKYLEAGYRELSGDTEGALRLLSEIELQNSLPQLNSLCKFRKALAAIKKDDYESAQTILLEASRIHLDQPLLKELLKVQVKLENDSAALETAEKLERMGWADKSSLYYKAVATRNLGLLKKSELAWKALFETDKDDSRLAYGYAEILMMQHNNKKAYSVLEEFIKNDAKLDLKCLRLAVHLLKIDDQEQLAFKCLDDCYKQIADSPDLLMEYFGIGHRIGEEEKSGRAISQLERLRQEGKIKDGTFQAISLDEIKEIIQNRFKKREKLSEAYTQGQALRCFFSSFFHIPFYLDWAFRTQPINFMPDELLAQFTTYVTNGFRIENNELVQITAPDCREIVIDYTALITLHQLGFLPLLGKVFDAVHFPSLLEGILDADKERYKPTQASQHDIYLKLDQKFNENAIATISLPGKNGLEAAIELAATESAPLVLAFIEKRELPKNVESSSLHDVLDFLYRKGRLSESRHAELKKRISDMGEAERFSAKEALERADSIIFDEFTLETAERCKLLEPLRDCGLRIIVESGVQRSIHSKIQESEYSEKVSQWQRDLTNHIREVRGPGKKRLFKAEHVPIKEGIKDLQPIDVLAVQTLQMAESKGLPLIADDRFIQMRITKSAKPFGTDALINYMFQKGVISIEEYSQAFLKLCEWRYRFVMPEAEVLVFFLLEFKSNPLGKPTEDIIKYANDSMKDKGLFLGREPTIPPTICGVKYYLRWLNVWIEALIRIWSDERFSEDNRSLIARQIFLRAFPQGPQGLPQDTRRNITSLAENSIIQHLFIGILSSKNPASFKSLLDQAFESLGFLYEKQVDSLSLFLKDVLKRDFEKSAAKGLALRLLMAFYGDLKGVDIDEKLMPILQELGVGITRKKVDDDKASTLSLIAMRNMIKVLEDRPQRTELLEKTSLGPLIFIPPSKETLGEITAYHDLIGADSLQAREFSADELLKAPFVSKHTKNILSVRRANLLSEEPFLWPVTAGEVQEALMKDFFYAQHMMQQLGDSRIAPTDRNRLLEATLKNALEPDLDTVLSDLPLLLQDPFDNAESIAKRIEGRSRDIGDPLSFLNWYSDNIYFIPYVSGINIYDVLKTKQNLRPSEFLELVRKWMQNEKKFDHFGLLLGVEIILNARTEAQHDEQEIFSSQQDFYPFIDSIFKTLLFSDIGAKVAADSDVALMQAVWSLRKGLAAYYLRYADLFLKGEFNDERKVALAWWMSQRTVASILKVVEKEPPQRKTLLLKKIVDYKQNDFALLAFRHHFFNAIPKESLSRYLTLNPADLNSYALCSLFVGEGMNDLSSSRALQGLRRPTDALAPEIRDLIISKLSRDLVTGNSQIGNHANEFVPLHWNLPLSRSVPTFFKNYYGEALDYLNQDVSSNLSQADQVCLLAKVATETDFLMRELPNFGKYIEEGNDSMAAIIISSLKVFLLSHDLEAYPKELAIFKEDSTILKRLSVFDPPVAKFNCSAFLEILLFLQERKYDSYTSVFLNQFKEVDYEACNPESIVALINGLIIFVLIGGNYEVLSPIIKAKKSGSRKIKDILKEMTPALESFLPYVPFTGRDVFRRVLNDLTTL